MTYYFDVARRAKRVFNLDLTSEVYAEWTALIWSSKAVFLKQMGPHGKQKWGLQWAGHEITVAYKEGAIVRIYSVDGKKGNKPYQELGDEQ